MNKNPPTRIHVDHYLQTTLLSRLSEADRPLRFSELKEDDIENSLFMYHANKLIARRAITKSDDGFRLTPDGARWINSIGSNMLYTQPTVKPLVQFVIHDSNNNILLSTRKGQLKELLNDYMLPGGLHKNGMSADENATRIAMTIFGDDRPEFQFLSLVESINTYSDGFIYHSISHIYEMQLKSPVTPKEDARFSFEWVPSAEIRADNPLFAKSLFVPTFFAKQQNNTLEPRDVINVDYT